MGFTCHNHRHLAITHVLNEMESIGIGIDIDDFIFDTLAVEGAQPVIRYWEEAGLNVV